MTEPQKIGYKVLIVDDSFLARRLVENIMSFVPEVRDIEHAEDGQFAFQYIHNKKYDLIFLDMDMPRLTGFQLLAKLKKEPPPHMPKVIIISADCTRKTINEALELGVDNYVSKPFKNQDVVKRFYNLLSGQVPVNGSVINS